MVVDQRCDGKTGFAGNSVQATGRSPATAPDHAERELPDAPPQLQGGRSQGRAGRKDKVGRATSTWCATSRRPVVATQSFDAETYLLLRTVLKVEAPERAGDRADERAVGLPGGDGSRSLHREGGQPIQSLTNQPHEVEHNKPIDEAISRSPRQSSLGTTGPVQ